MVSNGAMGLSNRRVMTRDPRSMDHGPWGCETNGPLDLLQHSGKPVVAWRACCGMEGPLWQKTAQWGLSVACRAFFEPRIEALIAPRVPISGSTRHFNSRVEAPLSYFLTKRARFCAVGLHCSDSCHLPWDVINGREARRHRSLIYSEYYWPLTCVNGIIIGIRAKISKKVLAFVWGSL